MTNRKYRKLEKELLINIEETLFCEDQKDKQLTRNIYNIWIDCPDNI